MEIRGGFIEEAAPDPVHGFLSLYVNWPILDLSLEVNRPILDLSL